MQIEIEGVLNSRPLANEMDEPLTPSHLIIGRRILSEPQAMVETEESETSRLTQEERDIFIKDENHFWKR